MKAKEGVINILNKILTVDLMAINQYFVMQRCVSIGATNGCTTES
jgi:bacterioferritin